MGRLIACIKLNTNVEHRLSTQDNTLEASTMELLGTSYENTAYPSDTHVANMRHAR